MHKVNKLLKKPSTLRNVNDVHKESLSTTDKIALWITGKVGTFPFFIFCTILVLLPIILPDVKWLMATVLFISSAFLQLVLLPLIMISQNLQGAHSEARADADYEINKKAEEEIKTVLAHLENQNEILLEQNNNILEILNTLKNGK